MISEAVAHELHISHGWTREFVDKLAPYYLATLTHMSRSYVTPVFQVIDEVWHAHILCTRDYADFCAKRFGRFIHHERSETINHEKAADDFFRDYGLSVAGLTSICIEYGIDQNLPLAKCTPDEPEPPQLEPQANRLRISKCGDPAPPVVRPLVYGELEASRLSVAKCGPPSPPTGIPNGDQLLKIARCGEPNQPTPSPPTGVPNGDQPLTVARCGEPSQPTISFAPAAG